MILSKILNNKSQTITGAAIILAAASLCSRVLGMARDRVLAHYFGTGMLTDAYWAAFKIPDLIYNLLILGALSAGFIPVFTKLFSQKKYWLLPDKEHRDAWELVNNVINILGLILIFLTAGLVFLTPYLIPLIAPGFDGEKRDLTITLTRVMFLSPIILGFSAVAGSVLQSVKNFLVYSFAPILYNLGIIFGAVVLVPILGPTGLAWGVVLGAALHLLIQLPALYQTGFRYRFYWNWRDKSLALIAKMMIPRTLGLAANQINLIVITAIASLLPAGSVAVFNYANNLQSFPVGIAGISFAVAAFPTLSLLATKEKNTDLIKSFSSTVRQILFFIIPLSIIFLMLRAQIVRVILGTGKFDWDSTIRTADALAFFSLSLFAQALVPLLARVFYALNNTITPFAIGVGSAVFNIGLSWYLTRGTLGVTGLALAFSIASIINLILLWVFLRCRLGSLDEIAILPALYKISTAGIFMGITIQLMKSVMAPLVDMQTFWGISIQGATAGLVGCAVYILTGLALKSHEMKVFVEAIKKKFVRTKNLPSDISEVQ
jgi:putative peptidoglycan lipid II flippase